MKFKLKLNKNENYYHKKSKKAKVGNFLAKFGKEFDEI